VLAPCLEIVQLPESLKPLMQPWIVQISRDDSHRKLEMSEGVDGDFPVTKMTAQEYYRAILNHRSTTLFALMEAEDFGAVIEAKPSFELDDFAHHTCQMLPHCADDSVDFFV
jgi:hypothetical protein